MPNNTDVVVGAPNGVQLTITRSIANAETGAINVGLNVTITAPALESGFPCGTMPPEDADLYQKLIRHCVHKPSEWAEIFSLVLGKIEAANVAKDFKATHEGTETDPEAPSA